MTIEDTATNIKRLEEFLNNIKANYKMHKDTVNKSRNISELQNSLYCLNDYEKVVKDLLKVAEEYQKNNMGEIIF